MTAPLTLTPNGFRFLKGNEQCRLNAYQDDAGIWTIGWGTVVYKNGSIVKKGDVVSQNDADLLLLWQVNLKTAALQHILPDTLNSNQTDTVIDFTYNEGIGNYKTSTFRHLVENDPNNFQAISKALMLYNKEHRNGKLVPSAGLTARRQRDFKLYATPVD